MKNKKKSFLGQRPDKILKFHVWDVIVSDLFFYKIEIPYVPTDRETEILPLAYATLNN